MKYSEEVKLKIPDSSYKSCWGRWGSKPASTWWAPTLRPEGKYFNRSEICENWGYWDLSTHVKTTVSKQQCHFLRSWEGNLNLMRKSAKTSTTCMEDSHGNSVCYITTFKGQRERQVRELFTCKKTRTWQRARIRRWCATFHVIVRLSCTFCCCEALAQGAPA